MKKAGRARRKLEKRIDLTSYLVGKRYGGILKEEAWYDGAELVKYSLAYIDHRICGVDNGRVLGYDNSHGHHHRHEMGEMRLVEFTSYDALLDEFMSELKSFWRRYDKKDYNTH